MREVYSASPHRSKAFGLVGLAICLVLATIGYKFGSEQYLAHEAGAAFYQYEYAPALSLACTGRLEQVDETPQTRAFLNREDATFDGCDVLGTPNTEWTGLDATSVYLYLLAALAWSLFGIDWTSLFFVAGVLTASFTVGVYFFLRCFSTSRALAAALSLMVLFAEPVREQIHHLRDFAKAPLILLSLGIFGLTLTRPLGRWPALILIGLAGAIVALGKGIRPDVFMVVPIVLAATCFMPPKLSSGKWWRIKSIVAVFACFIGALFITALPLDLLNASRNPVGGGTAHVFILGFGETFLSALGFREDYYAVMRPYSDEHLFGLVSLYSLGASADQVPFHSPSYGPAADQLFIRILATIPFDAFTRVFAAANAVGAYPINNLVYGPVLLIILLLASVTFWRSALFYFLCAGVLIAILTLQFAGRHGFFLIALGAAAIGLAASIAVEAIRAAVSGNISSNPIIGLAWRRAPVAGSVVVILTVVTIGIGVSLQKIQRAALEQVRADYAAMQWNPLPFHVDDARITPDFTRLPATFPDADGNLLRPRYAYLAVHFAFPGAAAEGAGFPQPVWTPFGGAAFQQDGAGFRLRANGARGYQLISSRISVPDLAAGATPGTRQLDVFVSGRIGRGWTVGVQTHDGSAWLGTSGLPAGDVRTRLRFLVPEAEPSVILVFEVDHAGRSRLDIDQLTLSTGVDRSCSPTLVTVSEVYDGAAPPQTIDATSAFTYYLPLLRLEWSGRSWGLNAIDVNGAWAGCVTGVDVAFPESGGDLPIEIVDAAPPASPRYSRGDWSGIWRDFSRWRWFPGG